MIVSLNKESRALFAVMAANLVAIAGFGVLLPVFPQYATQIGASGTDVTLALAAFSLGQLLSGPAWGRMADRFGRRPMIIASLGLTAATYLIHALCVTPEALMAARLASGLASGSFGVAFAVAADVSTPQTRARAMGIVGAGFSLGLIFGPAIGGAVAGPSADPQDFVLVCLVAAGLCAAAAVNAALLLPETRPSAFKPAKPISSLSLLREPALAVLMAFTFAAVAAAAMMESTFVLFADAVLGLGPLAIGAVFAGIGVIAAGVQMGAAGPLQRRFGERRLVAGGLMTYVVGLALMGATSNAAVAIVGVLVTALAFGVMTPALSSLVSFAAPAAMIGAAMGLNQAAGALGRVIGPAFAGPIYDHVGPQAPFLVGAALMAASLLLLRIRVRPARISEAEAQT